MFFKEIKLKFLFFNILLIFGILFYIFYKNNIFFNDFNFFFKSQKNLTKNLYLHKIIDIYGIPSFFNVYI